MSKTSLRKQSSGLVLFLEDRSSSNKVNLNINTQQGAEP